MSASRRSRSGLAAMACAVLVAAGLVASGAAGAVAVGVVSYVDTAQGGEWFSSAAPDGSAAVRLTSNNYQVYGDSVSDDGNSWVAGFATGPDSWNDLDRTFGLVYVHRAGSVVTTTVLESAWDTNPALTPDGHVWWLRGNGLFDYDPVTGVTTTRIVPGAGTLFAPQAGESAIGFAMSPDSSSAAVLFSDASTGHTRILAASWQNGRTGNYFENTFTDPDVQAAPDSFTWTDNATVLFTVHDHDFRNTAEATTAPGGSSAFTEQSQLAGFYAIRQRQDGSGTWWLWKDGLTTTHYGTTTDLAVPPASLTPRSNGFTTFGYLTSAATPPALTNATTPFASHANLYLSVGTVTYGRRAVYASWATYDAANPEEVDRGQLQYSLDHTTWHTLGWTTGAHPVPWPNSSQPSGNGYTQTLTRNTWFRWVLPRDAYTGTATSAVREVTVVPILSVHVAVSGSYRIVYGHVTRVGGTAYLYRYYSGAWHRLYAAAITSSGNYSFGKRLLPHGTYRVVVAADAHWAAATSKNFAL